MLKTRLDAARQVAAGDYVEALLARGRINDS